MKSIAKILSVTVLFLMLGVQASASTIYFQDWEPGPAGWYSIYDGWYSKYYYTIDPDEDPIQLVDDPDAPSPTTVHRITRVDAASNYLSPLIEVTPGESYSVSAWIKWVSGGWPFMGVSRYDASGSPIGLPLYDPSGTAPRLIWLIGQDGYHTKEGYDPPGGLVTPVPIVDEWHMYEKTFIVPPGTAYVRIMTELWKGARRDDDPNDAYFDDIAMHTDPHVFFVEPPTPVDGVAIEGISVPIEVSIIGEMGSALANVTFNWNGTDYIIYDDPLVLMFNFNNVSALGESSDYFVDLSKHNNNGVGLNFDGDEIVSGKSEEYGNAVDFDGIDDYIRIEDSPELNVIAFTIAFWFNARSPTGKTQSLVARGEDLGYDIAQWVIELDDPQNPDTVQLWIEEGNDTDHHYGLTTIPSANTWYHFAVTRSSAGTVKVYLNGVKENEWTNEPDPAIVPTPITVGARTNTPDTVQDYFDGTIDELRIWDVPLSEDEVAELYMSNLYKYDADSWTLYVNQSNLASGTHTYMYQASASDAQGTYLTEQRSVTVTAPEVTAQIIKGPYLQQVTSDSIVIMWETDVAVGSRVDYGLAGPGEFFVEDSTPVTIHEVQLTELASDTGYYYTVTSGGTTSPTSTFATAPDAPRSFRFAAYGDTRTNYNDHAAVIEGIINSAPEIVLHTGDLVENGDDYGQWGPQFFDPAYYLMINTPFLPIIGNHEGSGALFRDFFSLGDNDDWFAFTYGGVRFIGLNTHNASYSPGSAQYNWLAGYDDGGEWVPGELESDEYNNATWHIVYFHHPPYTRTENHSDDQNVISYLVPLFEQYGVDMVFNGHSHAYERYFHNGIYYIVTGGGGAPLRNVINDTKEPIREFGESVYHHCVIDVDVPGGSLTLSARYNSGQEFDTITLTKTPKASNPSPADEATGVAVDADLSWTAGIDAVSHDVYFGTTDPPPFKQNQTETSYDPGTLAPSTTYYWRINEFDGTTHTGDVWSFTTAPLPGQASSPSPAPGATDVSIAADLSWTAGSDTTSHDVYFGTNPTPGPAEFQGNQVGTTFDPGAMDYKTTCYWRIDEVGPGGVTPGVVWAFTTEGALPWIDGFESGGFTAGGWTKKDGDSTVHKNAAYTDTYGAKIKNISWIEKAISTAGFTDIHVKCNWMPRAGGSQTAVAEWYDGSSWNTLETSSSDSWDAEDWTCGSGANNNASFKIRFRGTKTQGNNLLYVDDVEITGTPSGSAASTSTGGTMHVGSIVVSYVELDYGIKKGLAEVVILDNNGRAVTGAAVTATFSEDISETVSAVTDGNGLAALETTKEAEGRCHLTVTIVIVEHSVLIYKPSENVETRDNNRL